MIKKLELNCYCGLSHYFILRKILSPSGEISLFCDKNFSCESSFKQIGKPAPPRNLSEDYIVVM